MRRLALMVLLMGAVFPVAHAAGLFGMLEIKTNRIASIPKWTGVLARMGKEAPQMEACATDETSCKTDAQRRWSAMLHSVRGRARNEQMDRVNRFVNQFPYITDMELFGKSDVWETPREFLAQSGDCEDYAITKYASLRLLGVPAAALRLVVVQDNLRGIAHAILAVRETDGEEMILDNLATRPVPAKYISQYKPYYAVNEENRWVFLDRNP